MKPNMQGQLELFHVEEAYAQADGPMTNAELYAKVASIAGLSEAEINSKAEIGKAKAQHSPIKRKIRWFQQALKSMNIIQKVDGERGVWKLANKNKKGLHETMGEVKLVAYSTNLGIAIWGNSKKVFTELGEPIHLCVTSPPYPLKIERGYGNVSEQAWVDFITESLEPIVENLVPGVLWYST